MQQNESKYFFIRHGQLVSPYLNHLKMDYDTLADLSTSRLNPSINSNARALFSQQTSGIDFSQVKVIYYNDSGFQSVRSRESAELIQEVLQQKYRHKISLVGLRELREVQFDVRKLISKDEFKKAGMPAIRTALYAEQINGNKNTESINEMTKRIERIRRVISKHADGDILFITHDFFMRVLEVFINRVEQLAGVTVADLERTELNYYFGGFRTDRKMRQFSRWSQSVKQKK